MQFKLIFEAMISSNKPLMDFLNKSNIKADFIEPIALIPKNLDYSNGQKYYEYYYQSLKNYILNSAKNKIPDFNEKELISKFNEIPAKIRKILNDIEANANNSSSKTYVLDIGFRKFEDCVTELSKIKDGIIGMAHPGVVFPHDAIKTTDEGVKLYDYLYKFMKDVAKNKAVFAEDNYQVYYQTNPSPELLTALTEVSSKYNFIKSGGLDTHISDIFSSKYIN